MAKRKLLNKTTANMQVKKTSRNLVIEANSRGTLSTETRTIRDKSKFHKSSERKNNKIRKYDW